MHFQMWSLESFNGVCLLPPAAINLQVTQLFLFQVYITCHSIFKNKHVWFLPYFEEIMKNDQIFLCS